MWDAYFRMGAYKCDVVVVIEMSAYIHGSYFLWVPILLNSICYQAFDHPHHSPQAACRLH